MNQVKVQFRTPQEVMDFTNVVSKYEYNMDLKKSSRKIVDAKSLLGILALGLENVSVLPCKLCLQPVHGIGAGAKSGGDYHHLQ